MTHGRKSAIVVFLVLGLLILTQGGDETVPALVAIACVGAAFFIYAAGKGSK